MLELNDVLLRGEKSTLSLMAREGEVTCLQRPVHWLYAMLGFEPVLAGFISIDGEPLLPENAALMRRLMAFAPSRLDDVGQVCVYEAPTVQDVFALRANRQLAITNGLLSEEVKRTGIAGPQARLLAVAVLLCRPILLVENPPLAAMPYLLRQAHEKGHTVIVCSDDGGVAAAADQSYSG